MSTDLAALVERIRKGELNQAQAEQALKQAGYSNGSDKPFEVEASEFKGHPTLSFSGNFRPFRLGFAKVRAILENADPIRKKMATVEKAAA